jgi:TPR repeat protein
MRVSHLAYVALGFALWSCKAETRATLSAECVYASDGKACARFGAVLEQGTLPTRFAEEPGVYFAIGCEEGSPEACARAQAWAKHYSDYEALESDVGCMLKNNAFACEELARNLRDGAPNKPEAIVLATSRLTRALHLYLAACAKDEAASCLGAARVHRSGLGDPPDPRAAEAEEVKACALGLGLACEVAGDRHAPNEATALYQKACDLPPSLPRACLKLARASEIMSAPRAVILAAYEHACERLSTDACSWLFEHGPHVSTR